MISTESITDPNFWHQNTNKLRCWHCTYPWEGPVFSYPVAFDTSVFEVRGAFCSLSCTKKYIIESGFSKYSLLSLFAKMVFDVYKIDTDIVPAPSRNCLKSYNMSGKGMSIEEFRQQCDSNINILEVPLYPFYFSDVLISNIDTKNIGQDKTNRIIYKSSASVSKTKNTVEDECAKVTEPIVKTPKLYDFYDVKTNVS